MIIKQRDKEIMRFLEEHKAATIEMIANVFYTNNNFSYDEARRRLKKLYDNEFLHRYTSPDTEELVYCFKGEKQISPHDLYTLKFYSKLIKYGAKVNYFKKNRKWKSTGKICDGFFEITYNGADYLIILEVDFTHMTSIDDKYLTLYNNRELQEEYKDYSVDGSEVFPKLVIMTVKDVDNIKKENVNYPFEVQFINLRLDNFVEKVLF